MVQYVDASFFNEWIATNLNVELTMHGQPQLKCNNKLHSSKKTTNYTITWHAYS
jgi:hypothetical protein